MAAIRFKGRKADIIGVILFLVIGSVFVLIGLEALSSNINLVKSGLTAEGRVTDVIKHYSQSTSSKKKASVTYRPEIEFTTSAGEIIRIEYHTGTNPPKYKTGQKINIIYASNDPTNILIDSGFEIYFFPVIFISLGGIAVIAGLAIIIGRILRRII